MIEETFSKTFLDQFFKYVDSAEQKGLLNF